MSNAFYRYVTPAVVPSYEALGWIDLGPTGAHHGAWSNTMVFRGDWEDPPEPGKSGIPSASKASAFEHTDAEFENAARAARADLPASDT